MSPLKTCLKKLLVMLYIITEAAVDFEMKNSFNDFLAFFI